jgi:hypothetical protein
MASETGPLQELLTALAKAFEPLRQAIDEGDVLTLFAELGLEFPDELAADPGFSASIDAIGALLNALPEQVEALAAAIEAEDAGAIFSATVALVDSIRLAVTAFDGLAGAIDARKNSLPGLTPQDVEDFAAGLPKRLIDYVVIRQAETGVPSIGAALDFIGVFDRVEKNTGSVDPLKPPYVERGINPRGAIDFLKSPGDVLRDRYDWGAAGFDGSLLFAKLEKLAQEMGVPALFTPAPVPTLDLLLVSATPRSDVSPPGIELALAEPIKAGNSFTVSGEAWEFVFAADAEIDVGSTMLVKPNGDVAVSPPSGDVTGTASVTFRTVTASADTPFILIGDADASRIEFKEFSATAGVRLAWNPGLGEARVDLETGAEIKEGRIVIDLSSADGFLGEIAAAARIETFFDIGIGYSTADGFHFRGSGGFEIQLPIHVDLGVIQLDALTIGAAFDDGEVPLSIGATIKANLGPLKAVVENIGFRVIFSFPDDGQGNLGPMDVALGFKPPNGVGLSIDAGVVKGGGYLYFDFEKEEYAGALELVFSEFLTLKAIGLVTTRMPDGSKGFSLLIIITAEFGSPIQLGFGFTLIGVGGLLGLNRTMRIEAIAEGVRTGSVESIMFPRNVIENAPRIISDLRNFFPPAPDRFLIGPMAKLGWGTPTLVSASLGVIIEIPPGNIVILGVLKVALPDEDLALILIQVNFIGALEPEKKRLWFFASLYESRVIFITLEGEMGLLIAWGDEANFVLSVGGFHPSFNPPVLPFPSPKRIAISILNESFARVRVEGYFAVTSNTVQFGARVEIFFGVDAFNIEGHIAFDALFQFSPFYFIISMSASLGVKVFGIGLFSVHIRGELEGTSPWHIEGEGSISLLFFSIDVPFSHTWGEDENTTLPPMEVMPLLEAEFNKVDNWIAELPAGGRLLVSLRKIEATEDLVLHPVGMLRVSQRAVPLDLVLDKVGNQKPSDATKVVVEVQGAGLEKNADAKEQFATAQFKSLSDAKKLSSPAYEKQKSGVRLSVAGQASASAAAVKRVVRYEEIVIDSNFKEHVRRFAIFAGNLFAHFLRGNAAARSSLSASYKTQKAPIDQKIAVDTPLYVVASSADNTAMANAQFASQAQADDFLREQVDVDPQLADTLHVIPAAEMRIAA